MCDQGGPGDREHDGTVLQEPPDSDLCGLRAGRCGDLGQSRASLHELSRPHWVPRDEPYAVAFAGFQHVFARAVSHVVVVLHGHDLDDLARGLELSDRYVAQADSSDLALRVADAEMAELILGRNRRVDGV